MNSVERFGVTPDGRAVDRIRLRGGGLTANILTWGATLQDLRIDGCAHPLVLGADEFSSYLGPMEYFGSIVGRVANRIGAGHFTLDGKTHELDKNQDGRITLHGGAAGSANRLWTLDHATDASTRLVLQLADGEMGFPGNVTVAAEYSLPGDGALQLDIEATTDAPTPCNFAHHTYFNLDDSNSALKHEFQVHAQSYLPVDDDFLATGEVRSVSDSPFDFRTSRAVSSHGYDCNFCLSDGSQTLRAVARLTGADGINSMAIETTEPGLQFYDAHHLGATGPTGLEGREYGPHSGIALEPQGWPNAINQPAFPATVLRPGETYRQTTRFVFERRAG